MAGILFITATVASLVSTALLNPILGKSAYLSAVAANQDQVIAGALCSVIAALASASIAVCLYPVLRKHHQGLALGAVGLRLMEATLYLVGVISVLTLLTLSQQFVAAGAPASSFFPTLGSLLLQARDGANLTAILAFYLGASLYYSIFYRSGLIPRWLSGWGLAGVTLGMLAAMLVMFRVTGSLSTTQVVLNLPIAVQEMVLAVWLIVVGFASPAAAPGPTDQAVPA